MPIDADRHDVVTFGTRSNNTILETIFAQWTFLADILTHAFPAIVVSLLFCGLLLHGFACAAFTINNLTTSPTKPKHHCVLVTVMLVLLPAFSRIARKLYDPCASTPQAPVWSTNRLCGMIDLSILTKSVVFVVGLICSTTFAPSGVPVTNTVQGPLCVLAEPTVSDVTALNKVAI